jgi:hypothetical protein
MFGSGYENCPEFALIIDQNLRCCILLLDRRIKEINIYLAHQITMAIFVFFTGAKY